MVSSCVSPANISSSTSESTSSFSNGKVYSWGANWYGELGYGASGYRNVSTDITSYFSDSVTKLAAGGDSSFAQTSSVRI